MKTLEKTDVGRLVKGTESLCEEVACRCDEVEEASLATEARQLASQLREDKLCLVVCGRFKQGKSQLINALLNCPGMLPTDVDLATAVVTTLEYGDQPRASVYLEGQRDRSGKNVDHATAESGESLECVDVELDQIATFVSHQSNPDNTKSVRWVRIQLPSELLQAGLVLVDTPGVESLNQRHTDVTYGFLSQAHAIVYVSDALSPLSTLDLQFVEQLATFTPQLVHVITKCDLQDASAIVESNREKLSRTLDSQTVEAPQGIRDQQSSAELEIPIVAVSSQDKLRYLDTGDPLDLDDSRFAELSDLIHGRLLANASAVKVNRVQRGLREVLASLLERQEMQLRIAEADGEKQRADLRDELAAEQSRLEDLLQQSPEWSESISLQVEEILVELRRYVRSEFARANDLMQELVDEVEPECDVNQQIGRLHGYLVSSGKRITERMSARIDGVHREMAERMGVPSQSFLPPAVEGQTAIKKASDVAPVSSWEKSVSWGRDVGIWAMGGSVVGGVAGGVLGFGVGLLSGGIATVPASQAGAMFGAKFGGLLGGATVGARRAADGLRTKEVAKLRQQVQPILQQMIHEAQTGAYDQLEDTCRHWKHHVRVELRGQLSQQRDRLQETIQALQGRVRENDEKKRLDVAALTARIREIEQLQKRVHHSTTSNAAGSNAAGQNVAARGVAAPVDGARENGVQNKSDAEWDAGSWADG